MATWNSRGLRGSTLEDLVNRTNEQYREKGLALIQKIPTPITPVRMDKENRHITLAYFEQRSTVDYIGAVQGIPVCFDAKECAADTFPLANIHPHQVEFMQEFVKFFGWDGSYFAAEYFKVFECRGFYVFIAILVEDAMDFLLYLSFLAAFAVVDVSYTFRGVENTLHGWSSSCLCIVVYYYFIGFTLVW